MFLGHFALGLAARRSAPRLSLAVLVAAAQFADLLWPLLLALGLESVRIAPGTTVVTPLEFLSYPWSHSLLMLAVWGALFGLLVRVRVGSTRAFVIVSALVVSHWPLDYVTHRPDMPLYPGGPAVGLGWWNSLPLTMAVELAMFAVGVWMYAHATRARDRAGRWAFVSFVVFLLVVYFANLFGPPPPSVDAIVVAGIAGGIALVAWAAWFDRHRALLPVLFAIVCAAQTVAAQVAPNAERAADADRQRMMTELGIREPRSLPPLATDPHRPTGLMPREGSTTSFMDEAGNIYVRSAWGAWSNYDEAKAGRYTLPDPLRLENGRRVTTAAMWKNQRRPELLRLFATQIYGRIPAETPKVSFQVLSLDRTTYGGRAIVKRVIGRVDNSRLPGVQPLIDLTMYLPPQAPPHIPIVVMVGTYLGRLGPSQLPPQAEQVLAAGWAFATVNTSRIQDDSGAGLSRGIIGLVNGGRPRARDDWGVLAAWSWGLSRALDYLETDPAVDATRAALQGHSRWGKTALLAGALDERWAVVWASCSGAMGASLERRNWGETIDNVASPTEYHWMAGNFLKYAGRWEQMPVDAHELIALVAPRPLFITGGSYDQWSDPHGEFLAARAADPVYRLLGKKGLGTVDMPSPDLSLVDGELAFREHDGGHTDAPDWPIFLQWAKRYLDPGNHGETGHGGRGAKR